MAASDVFSAEAGCMSFCPPNIKLCAQVHAHTADLYTLAPSWCLQWEHRMSLVLQELRHWTPDVVALQEVDHFKEMQEHMAAMG